VNDPLPGARGNQLSLLGQGLGGLGHGCWPSCRVLRWPNKTGMSLHLRNLVRKNLSILLRPAAIVGAKRPAEDQPSASPVPSHGSPAGCQAVQGQSAEPHSFRAGPLVLSSGSWCTSARGSGGGRGRTSAAGGARGGRLPPTGEAARRAVPQPSGGHRRAAVG
jgi:hypothetical protein